MNCWGSQTGGAGGHRNNAMPFCFVRSRSAIAALPPQDTRHEYCRSFVPLVSFVSLVFYADRSQRRRRRILRRVHDRSRRRAHDLDHVGEHRRRVPRRRPLGAARDHPARHSARRRDRRPSRFSRSRRLRPPRAARHAAGSGRLHPLSDRGRRRRRRRRRRDAPARQGARRAVQHGRQRSPTSRLRWRAPWPRSTDRWCCSPRRTPRWSMPRGRSACRSRSRCLPIAPTKRTVSSHRVRRPAP